MTWPGLRPWLTAAAVISLCLWWEYQVLFPVSPPIHAEGKQTYAVDQFGAGLPVGQTFRATADNLDAVRLQFASDRAAEVQLRWEFLTFHPGAKDNWGELYHGTTTVTLPAGSIWQRFEFPAQLRSTKLVYLFRVQLTGFHAIDSAVPPSITLIGSHDDSLKEGNIVAGPEQLVDQDLLFEALYDDRVFSQWRRDVNNRLPPKLRPLRTQLAVLGLYNLAVALFAATLIVERRRQPDR